MKTRTLPPLAVAGIGAALCLILFVVMLFVLIRPAQDELTAQTTRYNSAYPDSTPQAQATAKNQLAAAKVQVGVVRQKWTADELRYMPPYNVSKSLLTAWQEQTRELAYYLGPHIEQWIPTTGVTPLFKTVGLASPVTDPNLVTGAPLVFAISGSSNNGASSGGMGGGGGYPGGGGGGGYPGGGSMTGYTPGGMGGGGGTTGSLSVGGDFRQLLYHVQRWNTFDRLVLIDHLGLHGNSPFMSATYDATVIEFPQGGSNPAKPLPKGPGTGGAAGGAGGGYPGMGGPPGGMGGYPGMGGPPGAAPGG